MDKQLGEWIWVHLVNGKIVRGILKGLGKKKVVLEGDQNIKLSKVKKITYYKKSDGQTEIQDIKRA